MFTHGLWNVHVLPEEFFLGWSSSRWSSDVWENLSLRFSSPPFQGCWSYLAARLHSGVRSTSDAGSRPGAPTHTGSVPGSCSCEPKAGTPAGCSPDSCWPSGCGSSAGPPPRRVVGRRRAETLGHRHVSPKTLGVWCVLSASERSASLC